MYSMCVQFVHLLSRTVGAYVPCKPDAETMAAMRTNPFAQLYAACFTFLLYDTFLQVVFMRCR